jgi:hypothetical protein
MAMSELQSKMTALTAAGVDVEKLNAEQLASLVIGNPKDKIDAYNNFMQGAVKEADSGREAG